MKNKLLLFSIAVFLFACSKQDDDFPVGTLKVPSESYTVASGGTTKTFSFECNTGWKVEVISDGTDPWCTVAQGTKPAAKAIWGENNATITVTIAPNTTLDQRTATVRVRAGSVYYDIPVVQAKRTVLL